MSVKRKSQARTPRKRIEEERHKSEEREHAFARMNAAIVNALPVHIAQVDAKGVILFVNDAWKSFVTADGFKWANYGVGNNYITVCEQAHGDCEDEAQAVADGLRAVLAGRQKNFALEYPCHAPNEERWFRVMITPISETENAGAVVMHLNVSERRKIEEISRLSHQVFQNSSDHIAVVGQDYRYRQVNQAYETAHGLPRKPIEGMHIADLLGQKTFQKVIKVNFDRALAGDVVNYDSWFTFKNLGERFMAVTYSPLESHKDEIKSVMVMARDITKRKLAEEALMKSESQRRLAMGAANIGTWVWDISANTVAWSENVDELFGIAPGTFSGTYQGYLDLIHPSDLSLIQNAITETLEHDARYEVEHRVIWPDGSIHWLSGKGDVFRDSSTGNPHSMAGTVVDITERRQAQEALEKEQQFITTILDTAGAFVVVLDPEWRIVRFNRMCEDLTERTIEEMKGKSFLDLSVASGEDGLAVKKLLASFKGQKFPESFENAWVGRDRRLHWIKWSNTVITDKLGKTEYLIATGIDITERKQAEQTILESQMRIEGIIRTAIDAIISIDVNQRIVLFNPAAESMFGCTAENAVGKSLDQFIPLQFRKAHRQHIREFGQTGTIPRTMGQLGTVFGLRANGEEFPIEASISKVGVGKLKLYTVTLRDITDRLEAEQALQRSEERLDLALKGANLGVWDWNMQTGEVHHDTQWLEMLGYNEDEIESTFESWERHLHPQDKTVALKALQDHLDGLTSFYQTEYRFRTKNGKWKWILDTGKAVSKDQKGKPLRITGTHKDITDRKETEQELGKEREFINAVLETAGALVIVFDRQARVVRFNHACEKLTGYSFKEVQGKQIWDLLLLPEEIPEVKKVFRDLRQGAPSNQFENRWFTKDNKARWISWANTVLANDKGEVEYVIGTGIDITERRNSEQMINRLSRQNELILNSAGEGIYGLDLEGKTTFVNPVAGKMLGYKPQDLLGMPMHTTIHHSKPDGSPYPLEDCPIYEAFKDGSVHRAEEVLWRKDGTSFPVEYTITPILGENRKIEGTVVTFKDITDRKKTEEKIRRLSKVFMEAADPILIKDLGGKILDLNEEAERAYGWKRCELLGQPVKKIVVPEQHAQVDEYLRRCRSGEEVRNVESLRQTKNGKIVQVLLTLSLLTDEQGNPIGIASMAKDISELKQAENIIRESEERFQAFMNHSPAVKFLKDRQGRYVYVNRQFEEKLKLPMADCLGKTDQQLFPPDVARIFKEHDREALKTGEVLETEETTLDEKGNVRSWLVMKFPVRSIEGQLLLGGVALDITSRKQVEEALRQREAELLGSQEVLQTLGGQLISAQEDERRRISRELHDDMNQRLAVLALNIQAAQKKFAESAPMHQTLQRLYDGVSSLSDDVRHLAYQLHPSILDDLGLEVALQSFLNDFSKWEGIPVTFTSTDMTKPLPQEIASCLYRVTQECLRNVARHAQATQVEVKLIGGDRGLRLSIKDNGKGFKVEKKRPDKPGLGLIGMRERVRVVQGTYDVKSGPDQGTEITVWVPCSKEKK